jgi:hypothetical protein
VVALREGLKPSEVLAETPFDRLRFERNASRFIRKIPTTTLAIKRTQSPWNNLMNHSPWDDRGGVSGSGVYQDGASVERG